MIYDVYYLPRFTLYSCVLFIIYSSTCCTRFAFQPILEELESLLQLVRSTISLDHRAVGDDAGDQACKGRCIISYNMRTPSVRLRHMLWGGSWMIYIWLGIEVTYGVQSTVCPALICHLLQQRLGTVNLATSCADIQKGIVGRGREFHLHPEVFAHFFDPQTADLRMFMEKHGRTYTPIFPSTTHIRTPSQPLDPAVLRALSRIISCPHSLTAPTTRWKECSPPPKIYRRLHLLPRMPRILNVWQGSLTLSFQYTRYKKRMIQTQPSNSDRMHSFNAPII